MKEKLIAFFTDTVKEMKKVTWPNMAELRESTVVVMVVCAAIAVFIYIVDLGVSNALKAIL